MVQTDEENVIPERRYKRLAIGHDDLLAIFSGKLKVVYPGCPLDAKVINVQYDQSRDAISLLVEHESFEPVKLGYMIPYLVEGRCEAVIDYRLVLRKYIRRVVYEGGVTFAPFNDDGKREDIDDYPSLEGMTQEEKRTLFDVIRDIKQHEGWI